MYHIRNLTGNPNVKVVKSEGPFTVVEYQRDLSVTPGSAMTAFYSNQMNVRRRQVFCDLTQGDVMIQSGAMQWSVGSVEATTGVKGPGDLMGKFLRSRATGETVLKPLYTGSGTLVLEPTYRHLLLLDVGQWGGSVVLDDGLFLACSATLQHRTVMRSNLSSAVAGQEGLFNLCLAGKGVVCLESLTPEEELVEVSLQEDTLRVDGSFAIAWSGSLSFTVERSSRTLIGSAASGEGLVNVYRGTGRVLLAPLASVGEEPPQSQTPPPSPGGEG